ncbi:MAG: gfo/Idh/MocA family oxidoreductase, partial [Bacteroidetes bacterium]|nr:gfo/Idh/MocA family oxidoreductase [Bacteroidota bacterium]
YKNGVKLVIQSGKDTGVKYEGSEGWISNREDPQKLMDTVIGPDEIHLYESNDHYRNFIDCVLSRKETAAPAEIGHRSITMSHLGNIAMKLEQDLDWDPAAEKFLDNDRANSMLARKMREPWASLYREFVV